MISPSLSVEETQTTTQLAAQPHDALVEVPLHDEAQHDEQPSTFKSHSIGQTLAGVAGNILEWYDFALFAYFGDIIGQVFFPPSTGSTSTIKSFLVFGGAFLARPIGGLILGWMGDYYGRKVALIWSILLMSVPTFLLGILPTYKQAGNWAIVLLILVRIIQGLSVGGQLVSSLVYTCDNHQPRYWGLFGSLVIATAGTGTLLASAMASVLRAVLTPAQLLAWGWRLPFLAGVVVVFVAYYLRRYGTENYVALKAKRELAARPLDEEQAQVEQPTSEESGNPLRLVLARDNLRALVGTVLVSMLWAGAVWVLYVWLAIYMATLVKTPVPNAFAVVSVGSVIFNWIFFPVVGLLSDRYGRRPLMTAGAVGLTVFSPLVLPVLDGASFGVALGAQALLGVCLALWGSPMLSWLCESFAPTIRLSSIGLGFNVAQALMGGTSPALATWLVSTVGPRAPGYLLSALGAIGLIGVWAVAPSPRYPASQMTGYQRVDLAEMFLRRSPGDTSRFWSVEKKTTNLCR